jgi:hypothetical protein
MANFCRTGKRGIVRRSGIEPDPVWPLVQTCQRDYSMWAVPRVVVTGWRKGLEGLVGTISAPTVRVTVHPTTPRGPDYVRVIIIIYSAILVPLRKMMALRAGMSFHLTCRKRSSVGLSRFEPFHHRFSVHLNPDLCPERRAKNRCEMREFHE